MGEGMTAHNWSRPHFFSRDVCSRCLQPRSDAVAAEPCDGIPTRTDEKGLFAVVEAAVVDYFQTTHGTTSLEEGEWFVRIDGQRIPLSELAHSVANSLAVAS
jgi:hypothetical protein